LIRDSSKVVIVDALAAADDFAVPFGRQEVHHAPSTVRAG